MEHKFKIQNFIYDNFFLPFHVNQYPVAVFSSGYTLVHLSGENVVIPIAQV